MCIRDRLFLVPLVITYGITANLLVAAVTATIVGFCLSLIFLNRQRLKVASGIAELRHGERRAGEDESAEDAAFTGRSQSATRRLLDDESAEDGPAQGSAAQGSAAQGGAVQGSASASARPTP